MDKLIRYGKFVLLIGMTFSLILSCKKDKDDKGLLLGATAILMSQ